VSSTRAGAALHDTTAESELLWRSSRSDPKPGEALGQQRIAYARLIAARSPPTGLDDEEQGAPKQQRRSPRGTYGITGGSLKWQLGESQVAGDGS
jgi:hypothetical protein